MPAERNDARLVYVDVVRGLAMLHMALDHSSEHLQASARFSGEFAYGSMPEPVDLGQFLTRFSGVAVAPAFAFLAGFSVAILAYRSREQHVTRRLLIRASVLLLCQLLLNLYLPQPTLYFGVLAMLALGLLTLTGVRQLPNSVLLSLALLIIGIHPLLMRVSEGNFELWSSVLFRTGKVGEVLVYYPYLPWVGIILLGYVVGRDVLLNNRAPKVWAWAGGFCLVLFFLQRLTNVYGNTYPHDGMFSYSFWTFAKYPPDTSFILWASGQVLLALWALRVLDLDPAGAISRFVGLFGRVALFYYLLHFVVIGALSSFLPELSLAWTYVAWLSVIAIVFPICARYEHIKRTRPNLITKYL